MEHLSQRLDTGFEIQQFNDRQNTTAQIHSIQAVQIDRKVMMDIPLACTKLKADLDSIDKNENERKNTMSLEPVKYKIKWLVSFYALYIHITAIYGLYLVLSAKIYTTIFGFSLYIVSCIGVTAGAHRLWTHKSYKAKWPLEFILMMMYTLSFQYSIYDWSLDHRIHHKYTDTNSDPHNSKRGFFFSHIGWLLVERHPDFYDKSKSIDMEDLKKNRIVMFQKTFYYPLMIIICFYIPTIIPVYFWDETYLNAYCIAANLRHIILLHITFTVNSVAHMWGYRPFDASITPVDNPLVAIFALGEGWHNYHHVFPWDYKTSELFNYKFNLTTAFIDFFAIIGWAYDMKTIPKDMILKRANRTGDGTHNNGNLIWGWGDSNICSEDRILTTILNKKDD